jgi:thymidylate synthase
VVIQNTANQAWAKIMDGLTTNGKIVKVKGVNTRECLNNTVAFDMNHPICYHQDRRLNYAFSASEAYEIAHGDNRVENLAVYNINIAQFSDDGLIFNGAYGPPFNEQLMFVVNTLLNDTLSRQAVLTIWKQNPIVSKDIRCTVSLQFMIRNNELNTFVNMRSSDCWLGIPYDFFNFTIMTLRVLTLLNDGGHYFTLGDMYWNAASSHAYEHDWEKIAKVIGANPNKSTSRVLPSALSNWNFVVNSLQACMDKDEERIVNEELWRIRP